MIVKCPDTVHLPAPLHGPLFVVGCGRVFDSTPDHEGLHDCTGCGVWFANDTADDQQNA